MLHTATVNLFKVAAMVATKFRVHTKQIGCMEKRKLESLASCKTDATIMDARCRLNTHHGVSAWGLKAVLFTIRFVNSTHSGPQVSKMWVLLFALLFSPLKITIWRWQTSDQNRIGCGDSLWSSTVAVNALYWKIQTVTKLLLSVHFHYEHLLQKKNKKKSCTLLSSLLSLLSSTETQSILYLLSPLKTLE